MAVTFESYERRIDQIKPVMEKYGIADFEDALKMQVLEERELNGKKVAVIGSGPAGLSVAGILAQDGYKVTIFEKEAKAGGYLRYGIPEYRLPTEVVDKEIKRIQKLGVEILLNSPVEDVEKLKKDGINYFDPKRIIEPAPIGKYYGKRGQNTKCWYHDTGSSFYEDIKDSWNIKEIKLDDFIVHNKSHGGPKMSITNFIRKYRDI